MSPRAKFRQVLNYTAGGRIKAGLIPPEAQISKGNPFGLIGLARLVMHKSCWCSALEISVAFEQKC